MRVSVFIAAALAVSSVSIVAHAEDASPVERLSTEATQPGRSGGGNLGLLLKNFLRAGNAAAMGGRSQAPDDGSVKTASLDPAAGLSSLKEKGAGAGRPYHGLIARYASLYGVPVSLAHAIVKLESNYRPTAHGRAGEIGLMQIKPATARMMGYVGSAKGLYDPETNIKYGMKYLSEAMRLGGGSTCATVLKYNAGHGARRMNSVSSAYCAKVKRILAEG